MSDARLARALRRLARPRLAALLVLGMAASGCAPGFIKIHVTSTSTTNSALPFYMLVRAVDAKTYLSEGYADIAPKVVAPDASVIKSVQVYPGMPLTMWVKTPDKKAVAAYFLFTEPVEPWRMIFEPPAPFSVDIELEGSRIQEGVTAPPEKKGDKGDKGDKDKGGKGPPMPPAS